MADIRVIGSEGKKPTTAKGAAKKAVARTSGKIPEAPSTRKALSKETVGNSPSRVDVHSKVTAEERRRMIAEAAYIRAEKRGFVDGNPNDDWLAAEREIDRILSRT